MYKNKWNKNRWANLSVAGSSLQKTHRNNTPILLHTLHVAFTFIQSVQQNAAFEWKFSNKMRKNLYTFSVMQANTKALHKYQKDTKLYSIYIVDFHWFNCKILQTNNSKMHLNLCSSTASQTTNSASIKWSSFSHLLF